MEDTLIKSSSGTPLAAYGVAVLAAVVGLLIRLPLAPILHDKVPYITFFLVTAASAGFGGFGPGLVTTMLGAILAGLYVVEPYGSLLFRDIGDFLGLGIFIVIGSFISYQAGRLKHSSRHENALRLLFQQTLHSIGDAVISTDGEKRIRLMNDVAEELTGWTLADAKGRPITEVFRIVREGSDTPADNPIDRVLTTGVVVGLANHTELIKQTGERIPIDDSGAPVRDQDGNIAGAVLVFRDITTRRQAELDLAESERRSKELLESISDAFVLLDSDWRIIQLNAAAEDLLKAPANALLGRNHWELHPATVGSEVEVLYKKAVAENIPVRFDYYHEPWRQWFDISAYASGQGLALYFRDITERKRIEQRDAFVIQLDDAVRPLTDADEITHTAARLLGERLNVNRCAYADVEEDEDTFNLTGDYNRDVPSIVGRYTFTQFGAECLRLMREGKPYVVEDSETDSRTEEVRASYRLTLIRSVICVSLLKQGRFVAAMAVHQTTPRKWEEAEVELMQLVASRCWESIERTRVTRELQEREQRYRFLAESIPQMVWTATTEGNLDYVNRQVTEYFGTSAQMVLGEGWLRWVHPEESERAIGRWKHSLETHERYETAFRLLRASDSTWRWHLVRAEPLLSADGTVAQWFGTCTDFEDQMRARQELERVNREMEEFAYVASHDLQEPLRMVNIYTQLLMRDFVSTEVKAEKYAALVRQGVTRMEFLIRDLLSYSRSVKEELPVGKADLATALTEAMSVLKNRIEENVAVITADSLPSLRGDTAQLAHVFQNLLSNSLKYRKKEACPEIHISAEIKGEECVICVRDNGIGFEQRYAERIFGLFKRLHKEEYPGTGLGLAICQRIIERYGGRMWAEGTPQEGAKFYLSLPCVMEE